MTYKKAVGLIQFPRDWAVLYIFKEGNLRKTVYYEEVTKKITYFILGTFGSRLEMFSFLFREKIINLDLADIGLVRKILRWQHNGFFHYN